MSRLRFVSVVLGAIALHSAVLVGQNLPAIRPFASLDCEAMSCVPGTGTISTSPNGKFVAHATATNLQIYDVASRQSWNIADGWAWQLSWSPRGDMIAYVGAGPDKDGDYAWVIPVNATTGKARGPAQRVTIGQSEYPSISPDGRWIAVSAIDSGGNARHLAIVRATGGPERLLQRSAGWYSRILWSADGRTLFVDENNRVSAPRASNILKIPVDGGTPEIIRSKNERLAGMMADRRHLVLVPNKQLMAARVAAGDQATVIDTTGREVGNISLPVGWEINFDGIIGDSALIWIRTTTRRTLEMRPTNGGNARSLPLIGESNENPLWSPDGTLIAYQVSENDRTSLAVINADGKRPRVFRETTVIPAFAWGVSWSPDSRSLAFLSPDRHRLSVLDVGAGTHRTVLEDTATVIGVWQWRADGKAIDFLSVRQPLGSIEEVTLSGHRRKLWDQPTTIADVTGIQFFGGSDLFIRSDTAASTRPLGSGKARQFATVPTGTRLSNTIVSSGRRWIGGFLFDPKRGAVNQIELFSTATGIRTVLDLPFDVNPFGWRPEFLPGDSALLVVGKRSGETKLSIYRVPTNGDAPSVFASIGKPRNDAGGVSAVSASPDGRWVAYSVQTELSTQSLVLIDLRTALPRTTSRPARE